MLVLYIFILMFTNSLNHIKKNIHSIYINRITILTLLVSIFLTFNTLYFQSIGKGIGLYSGLFQVTIQSQIIEIILLLIGISILFSWPLLMINNSTFSDSYLKDSSFINDLSISKSDYYSLIAIFSILGGSLLMSSLDLLSMYLSIELQSFALYILATLNKDKLSATSAGLKYFLLGGLSSCFILLGAGIIYSYTGLTQFESINALLSIPTLEMNSTLPVPEYQPEINRAFTIGLIFILVGFLFKISAAPFYQWAPDVYDGTPTIVTVWLTIVAKLTIVIFLQGFIDFSIPNLSLPLINNGWINLEESSYIIKNLLLISSLLSLIIGTVAGLSQIKVKRLLAFSSISHVGFLLLALGIYSQKSIDSFIFYIIQYSITSLNIFLILLAFGYLINKVIFSIQKETDVNYLYELRGQLNNNSILSASLAICLFSMAGIPPLIGFFSKQFVLFSSMENGNNFLSIIAIIVSVISASYYLKLIKITFFENNNTNGNYNNLLVFSKEELSLGSVKLNIAHIHSYIISILTFLILFFFIDPSILLNVTQLISLTIFNL